MPADPQPDVVAAIIAFLLDDDGVTDLVDDRVGWEIPKTSRPTAIACVVLNPVGGPRNPGGGYQRFGATRIDAYCYGTTRKQAHEVYRAVYAALKHMRRQVAANVLLHSADVLSKGALGTDPKTQWDVSLSSWSVLADETTAT